jgi:hypothetical protein
MFQKNNRLHNLIISVVGIVMLMGTGHIDTATGQTPATVPGVVINHLPAESQQYIGGPSIAILPNGDYVAIHDYFGPVTEFNRASLFRSQDQGKSWTHISEIDGIFWETLFYHKGALYCISTFGMFGQAVIRRSTDGGETWTEPKDSRTGLLSIEDRYHCAPVPVVVHQGRIWRAFDLAHGKRSDWPIIVMSAPEDADLLNANNWTTSEPFKFPWTKSQRTNGNVVVTPKGGLVTILQTDDAGVAAIVNISDDGKTLSCTQNQEAIPFPGGTKKFTIRYDSVSKQYWALTNYIKDGTIPDKMRPGQLKNTLALTVSPDLKQWTVRSVILHHPDAKKHGFQHVDWLIEGDDIIAVSSTAYDDEQDGANSAHDANYLTFHRIQNFRKRSINERPQ